MPLPLLALAPAIGEVVKGVLNRILPAEKMSEKERAELELALVQYDWQTVLGQIGINAEEAKSESLFVAGWRPFIGWVCGSALAWTFCLCPMFNWLVGVLGAEVPPPPTLDMTLMTPVLLGMLGLGGLRTYEKVQDANRRR